MNSLARFKLVAAAMAWLGLTAIASPSFAAEATTFASSFAVPVFNQIDQNGVDLVTGTWRVRTPTIWVGEGEGKQERGLQWIGQAWTHIGQPSLWKNDNKYIVMYKGQSHEFNGSGSGWSKRAPIDGSSLACAAFMGGDVVSNCTFRDRDGDVVVFKGFYSPLSNFGPKMGFSSLQNGNVGIQGIDVSEVLFGSPPVGIVSGTTFNAGSRQFGYWAYFYGTSVWDYFYKNVDYYILMADQRIKITTPNNNDSDEHYLLPKSTTQTITDDFGNQWGYTFDGDRDLILVTQPGGASSISATYYGNHKVKTITTTAGTWYYTYTDSGTFGTTIVVSPRNETTFVKYHRENGYVVEARDALNRTTLYSWNNSTRRLDRVTFPEGNYVAFTYDGRGNVLTKAEVAKGGVSSLVWQAGYAATCTSANQANCNQPDHMIDPKGNQTDFEYTGNSPGPTKITLPAPTSGSARPTIVNQYSSGALVRSATCRTLSVCAGTADEVIKEYGYIRWQVINSSLDAKFINFPIRVLTVEKVTADGQTLFTCHQYDTKGHRVATTPPSAGRTSCPTSFSIPVTVGLNPPSTTTRVTPTFPGGQ